MNKKIHALFMKCKEKCSAVGMVAELTIPGVRREVGTSSGRDPTLGPISVKQSKRQGELTDQNQGHNSKGLSIKSPHQKVSVRKLNTHFQDHRLWCGPGWPFSD